MLAVFMLLSPRDAPRYYSESSRMATRSNPLSPGSLSAVLLRLSVIGSRFSSFSGLGFRPQPDVEKNIIYAYKNGGGDQDKGYAESLDHYLSFCKFEAIFSTNRSLAFQIIRTELCKRKKSKSRMTTVTKMTMTIENKRRQTIGLKCNLSESEIQAIVPKRTVMDTTMANHVFW